MQMRPFAVRGPVTTTDNSSKLADWRRTAGQHRHMTIRRIPRDSARFGVVRVLLRGLGGRTRDSPPCDPTRTPQLSRGSVRDPTVQVTSTLNHTPITPDHTCTAVWRYRKLEWRGNNHTRGDALSVRAARIRSSCTAD
jgi:hypothetical protein